MHRNVRSTVWARQAIDRQGRTAALIRSHLRSKPAPSSSAGATSSVRLESATAWPLLAAHRVLSAARGTVRTTSLAKRSFEEERRRT